MAISFTRYVDITSGVGAGAVVRQRDLILRVFTTNELLPTQSFAEFTSLADVGTYFGTTSEEYKRSSFYFGWISKSIQTPKKISFARWVDVATAGKVFGKSATYSLGTFTAVTNGSLNLTIGATTHTLTGINLSAAVSLAGVASLIQAAIQGYTSGGADWTAATVSYDVTNARFKLVGGVAGTEAIAVNVAGSGTDLAPLLGWTTGSIVSQGSAIESITTTLTNSAQSSNNFGSFLFISSLSTNQITEAATWNSAQNVLYQYMVPVSAANAAAVSAAIASYAGCAMTLSPLATEYPEMVPSMVMAATNYSAVNSVQNYMYQFFALTPSVLTDVDANTYDALLVNYYGRTQTAGQIINFYQRGYLTGTSSNPTDQNTYANEQWLKDAIGSRIMTLLLSLAKVSANNQGRAQLVNIIQSVIQQALLNGTISVGKPLSDTQKLYITNATNDSNAWYQVQSTGYWLDCVIESYVNGNGHNEYKAVYTLIYSKDDVIRLVEGSDVLI